MSHVPKIQPIKFEEYEVKERQYDVVPKIPFRSVVLGPSGSGKNHIIAKHDIEHL